MPEFVFTGPDGKDHTVEGPEGATKEQAFKILQQHLGHSGPETPGLLKSAASGLIQGAGAPGDFSKSILGNAPRQASMDPWDRGTYYRQLTDALNKARAFFELPTSQGIGNAVGMQPTSPVTPAEKAVQFGASAIPGALMGGSLAGRAAMGAAPAANAVRAMGMAPTGAASPISGGAAGGTPSGFGQQMAQNVGQNVGNALQNQLLKQGLKYGAGAVGHAVGGPIGGLVGHILPKVLRMD